jgi:hypothetical protein
MRDSNVANAAKESTQGEFSHGLSGHCPRSRPMTQIDPELPFPVGIRNRSNAHMSGPSVEQADWGWHLG